MASKLAPIADVERYPFLARFALVKWRSTPHADPLCLILDSLTSDATGYAACDRVIRSAREAWLHMQALEGMPDHPTGVTEYGLEQLDAYYRAMQDACSLLSHAASDLVRAICCRCVANSRVVVTAPPDDSDRQFIAGLRSAYLEAFQAISRAGRPDGPRR